jgi:hypothetical protein
VSVITIRYGSGFGITLINPKIRRTVMGPIARFANEDGIRVTQFDNQSAVSQSVI